MNKLLLFIALSLFSLSIFAIDGRGTLRGTIIDAGTGEPIMGANVMIENTSIGTVTDFDGNYTLKVEDGIYNLKITALGYASLTIQKVTIIGKKVKSLDISLKSEDEQLEEVVITSSKRKNSASALLTMQKKSVKLLDGISSESFSKTGDSDVAGALKRVTGVSVQGGKYVFVRGLSDRYTKTTLNSVSIPGLDPDRNTVQMDLFPTNLVDNIVVYKTFTPDLDGDFTGGLVDISTKDFPRDKTLEIGLGFGYTNNMNFNKDFILYQKQKNDWLGFGNSTRKLGFSNNTIIPDESLNDPKLTALTNSFSKELGVTKGANSFLDESFNVSFGNQYQKKNYTLGVNFALNYANDYKYYDDVKQAVYFKDTNSNVNQLDKREVTTGSFGENNVIWSGLLGTAFKFDKSKYALSLFHSQNGTGQAADYISQNFDETNATLYKEAIQYTQRSVTNIILKGEHHIKGNDFVVDWKISPSLANILEPDVRSTRLSFDATTGTFKLQLGDGAGIDRYYRTLNEQTLASKINALYKVKEKNKIKIGVSNTYKYRDYEILSYVFEKTSDFNSFTENPNDILIDANIWNATTQSGMYVKGSQNLNNTYKATSNVLAFYAMDEMEITKKLKTIFGVRTEKATIDYDGYYSNIPFKKRVHDELVFLPSLNFIYALNDNTNLRLSYSQTVARPSFKEKSNAHIQDPISQNNFIGNLNLKETNINNVDIRWENFFSRGEMISVSGFYKNFNNPIELVPFQLSPNSIQPKNTKQALVYGGELEMKKSLTKEDSKFNISVGANVSYIISKVDTKQVIVDISGKTEYELRKENARNGETISQYRTMQGQSPFIVNASLNISKANFDSSLSYNVQGKKLAIVGSGIVPDVFESPFNSLNFKGSYKFGKDNKYKVSASFKNILNDNFNQYFDSFGAENEIYRQYSKQQSFSLSFSYKIY